MKKTKREYYNDILAIEGISEDIKAFVKGEIALLDKKNTNRKPTKAQTENEKFKAEILSILADTSAETAMTASEIRKASTVLTEAGEVQKTSALLAQLVKAGEIHKDTNGKKTVFYAIVADDADDAVQALEGEITD